MTRKFFALVFFVVLAALVVAITVGCDKECPNPNPAGPTAPTLACCNYAVTPTAQNFSYQGGNGGLSVSTNLTDCTWTAMSNTSWITVTAGSSGTGNGSVSYSVAANTGPARSGTMTVAGHIVTITQDAAPPPACTYAVQETPQNFPYQGGNGGFSVSTQSGCSWTAVSNATWVAVTGGSPGVGSGSVTYIVAGNGGPARTGTISVAGKTVTIVEGAYPQ